MDFILNLNKATGSNVKAIITERIDLVEHETIKPINRSSRNSFLLLICSKKDLREFSTDNHKIEIVGDLITDQSDQEIISNIKKHNISDFGGFFYIITIDSNNNIFKVFSSLFNILPIYYYEDEGNIVVSSRMEYIIGLTDKKTINKKYLLERMLFNYAFSDETIFREIKLLPSNHFFSISKRVEIKKHFNIIDHFVEEPLSGKKVLESIGDNFTETAGKYFPEVDAAVSFTSGFDGRTLVAVGKKLKKNFFTYSFGSADSIDLTLPELQVSELGLQFESILLNDHYIKNNSLNCGLDLITKTEGNASFARAHYRYAVEKLSKSVGYIITGNFGSELFRAFHNPGVMISQEMISYFESDDDSWIDEITSSDKIKYLRYSEFQTELDELIGELQEYKQHNKGFDKNKFFYKYIFEEVFRKYFGPEIVMQGFFLKNRAPFIDPVFIKFLLRTKYAGVYSKFFDDNPVNRFKGQLPYSYIINNSYPPLMNMITGKGYKPLDLMTLTGKFKLVQTKFRKKVSDSIDPFSVNAAFLNNSNFYSTIKIDDTFFNRDLIHNFFNGKKVEDLNNVINILSLNYYLNNSAVQ